MRTHSRFAAPLPIFNKGKRPRQALLAHPNNLSSPAQTKGALQWQKNGEATPQWAPFNGNCSQQKRFVPGFMAGLLHGTVACANVSSDGCNSCSALCLQANAATVYEVSCPH